MSESNGNAASPPVVFLDDQESKDLFDRSARELLGMSGDEFLRLWDAGHWKSRDCDDSKVLHMEMLMPFARHGR